MAIHFHWFLPTNGDSRDLIAGGHGSTMRGDRPADLRYLTQLAQAAEINGFKAVLTPTGLWCEDAAGRSSEPVRSAFLPRVGDVSAI